MLGVVTSSGLICFCNVHSSELLTRELVSRHVARSWQICSMPTVFSSSLAATNIHPTSPPSLSMDSTTPHSTHSQNTHTTQRTGLCHCPSLDFFCLPLSSTAGEWEQQWRRAHPWLGRAWEHVGSPITAGLLTAVRGTPYRYPLLLMSVVQSYWSLCVVLCLAMCVCFSMQVGVHVVLFCMNARVWCCVVCVWGCVKLCCAISCIVCVVLWCVYCVVYVYVVWCVHCLVLCCRCYSVLCVCCIVLFCVVPCVLCICSVLCCMRVCCAMCSAHPLPYSLAASLPTHKMLFCCPGWHGGEGRVGGNQSLEEQLMPWKQCLLGY